MTAHRVLVTGPNGFVGRHAVDALLDAGHEVVAVSREPAAAERPGVRTLHADLLDPAGDVDALVAKAGADILLHLAWETRHDYFWSAAAGGRYNILGCGRAVAAGGGPVSASVGGRPTAVIVSGDCMQFPVEAGAIDTAIDIRLPPGLLDRSIPSATRPR